MELQEGIKFDVNPTKEKDAVLTYSGTLYKNGASTIKIVYGFGNEWNHTTEQTMEKTEDGFSAKIKMRDYDSINFCFRNEVYEWDNNNSCNYQAQIGEPVAEEVKSYAVDPKEVENILTNLFEKDISRIESDGPIRSFRAEIERTEAIAMEDTTVSEKESQELTSSLNEVMDEILNPIIEEISQAPVVEDIEIESAIDVVEESLIEAAISEEDQKEVNEVVDSVIDQLAGNQDQSQKIEGKVETSQDTALIATTSKFVVSNRQLSSFYLFKKRMKLAFLKVFVGIPKMLTDAILGEDK